MCRMLALALAALCVSGYQARAIAEPCLMESKPGGIANMLKKMHADGYEQRGIMMLYDKFPGQLLVNKEGDFMLLYINPNNQVCFAASGDNFKVVTPGNDL